jgi:hypothetical protein
VQEIVLKENPDADVQVYAVWFAMYPGDVRERWPMEALSDPRVVHYWDDGKNVGRWYADRVPEMATSMASGSKGHEAPILWDAYLVYGPDARWDAAPTGLRRWGRTIMGTRDALKESVEGLLKGTASN